MSDVNHDFRRLVSRRMCVMRCATPPHLAPDARHAPSAKPNMHPQRSDDRSIKINRVLGPGLPTCPPLHTANRYPGRAHRRLSSACVFHAVSSPRSSPTPLSELARCQMPIHQHASHTNAHQHDRSHPSTSSVAPLRLLLLLLHRRRWCHILISRLTRGAATTRRRAVPPLQLCP